MKRRFWCEGGEGGGRGKRGKEGEERGEGDRRRGKGEGMGGGGICVHDAGQRLIIFINDKYLWLCLEWLVDRDGDTRRRFFDDAQRN
jgi:hypothetical protein